MEPQTDANAFPLTQWTLVIESRAANTMVREKALEELCKRYWLPIYAYARRRGHSPADSEDLTQGFFTMMLTRHDFGRARKNRGTFRAYIRTAFRNFAADYHKHAKAKKRGGGAVIFSIDQQVGENRYREFEGEQLNPDEEFDRHFAIALLERALARMRREYESTHEVGRFELLRPYLDDAGAPSYAELATSLHQTESAAKSTIYRFRGQFRRIMLQEVDETLGRNGDSEGELRYLLGLFS